MLADYQKCVNRESYSFFFSMILLGLYELLTLLTPRHANGMKMINGVDAWFERFLELVPFSTWIISIVLALIGIWYVFSDKKQGASIQPGMMFVMWLESWLWAIVIFLALPRLIGKLLLHQIGPAEAPSFLTEFTLSLGAGFYEEFFFRLILVQLLSMLGNFISIPGGKISIILGSAILFSAAHYIGPYGDKFMLFSFIYRMIFGLIMSVMLVARNFGITAWTHALYDVLVFMFKP